MEGNEPHGEGECAIATDISEMMGIGVGDTITLIPKTGEESFLKGETFTVSGIMQHPDHYRKFLVETFNIMISQDAIDSEKLGGMEYTSILVRYSGDVNTFSEEYEAVSTSVVSQVNELGKIRMHERYNDYISSANKQIAEAEKELNDGKLKLDEARATISESEAKIADAEKQLVDAATQIAEGEAELEEKKSELEAAKRTLDSASTELESGKIRLDSARAELDAAESDIEPEVLKKLAQLIAENWEDEWGDPPTVPSVRSYSENYTLSAENMLDKACDQAGLSLANKLKVTTAVTTNELWQQVTTPYNQIRDGESQYASGLQEYNNRLVEYNNGLEAYRNGEAQIQEAESTLNSAKAEFDEKSKELEAAKAELEKGKQEFAEKEKEYNDGVEELEKAKIKLSELIEGQWIAMPRSLNLNWMDVRETSRSFGTMGNSFAILFVALGALVCYATIGRIINEQRSQIGTTKAVGFFNREILGKYLLFGMSASVLGVIIGILLAYFVLEKIMLKSTSDVFLLGDAERVFQPIPAILAVVIAVLIATLAVWFACKKLLKRPARELMNNEVPRTAYNGTFGGGSSGRMYDKLIVRNIFTDWQRVLITIASVAGCCIILTIGFTLKQSFVELIDRQFAEIIGYDAMVEVLPEDSAIDNVRTVVKDANGTALGIYQTGSPIRIGETLEPIQIICAAPDKLGDYFHIREVGESVGSGEIVIPDEGIVIFTGIARAYDLKVGDTVEVIGGDGSYRQVKISGIYESYAGRTAFMSESYAKEIFDYTKPNAFFIKGADGLSADDFSNINGFLGYTGIDDMKVRYEDTSKTMNLVIVMSLIMAVIMAAVVLLNLVRIQLNQKRREMTIMRVNGFTIKETIRYILKENIITTIIGIAVGLVLGNIVARTTLSTFDRVELQMYKGFMGWSNVLPIIITLVFALLVNMYALKEVKHLQLRDANH